MACEDTIDETLDAHTNEYFNTPAVTAGLGKTYLSSSSFMAPITKCFVHKEGHAIRKRKHRFHFDYKIVYRAKESV